MRQPEKRGMQQQPREPAMSDVPNPDVPDPDVPDPDLPEPEPEPENA